ncbi:uncharacterized protein LOC130621252 [Hydractinia symbiolongicarpus]|uniref:uncharacterized protein LOC130621252 n=1 Tax=Hydractinia symbiolongicarpus TaxID=13093 RepID=UPI00254D3011|nr:uncharacterized protein LOC130621252 [Hydractinia symbiolongicarpus]
MSSVKPLGADDRMVYKTAYFANKVSTIINANYINDAVNLSSQQIINGINQCISEGSGWTIESVDAHYFNLIKYNPLSGSSYIELPEELRNSKKGLINIKNIDNECFRWCHIRHLNPQKKNQQRIKRCDRAYINELNYDNIEFHLTIKEYNRIEKQINIRINVFGYEDKLLYPIYVSKEKYKNSMSLLLITKDENKHYVLIEDFNSFMFNQTKPSNKKHFYFEAISEKIHGCAPENKKSYTEAYQKDVDCGYRYKVVCRYDDKYSKQLKHIEVQMLKEYIDTDIRVRDHCYVTGNYRGSAHKDCNPNHRITDKIPLVFHNLTGYDSHFIMQQIGKIVKKHSYKTKNGEQKEMDIIVILNSMEKYMVFMLSNNLTFIDSFQFISSSLEKLVDNLTEKSFKYTKEEFGKSNRYDLMTKKGVYPSDYMDCLVVVGGP